MKKKSANPVIKSFEEFKDSINLVRKANEPGKYYGVGGLGSKLNTYQFTLTGYYIHAPDLFDAYEYYKDHNLWFDTETHTIDRINSQ